MRTQLSNDFASGFYRVLSIAATGLIMTFASAAHAQVFQAYTFEPDLQGFAGNPAGPAIGVTLETSGLGGTAGPNSMKLAMADFSGFAGAQTSTLHSTFTDGQGLDAIRFDLTNTNRYVPPDPVPGTTPTFANTSVMFFGEFADAPGEPATLQFYPLNEEPIGTLEPGTHEIEIDLQRDEAVTGTGGLWIEGGEFKSYTEWIDAGFTPFTWQLYLNKNVKVGGGPTWAWTVYVDNIRLVREVEGVPGDYNNDGTVDTADYVAWRTDPAAFGGDPDGYNTWVQNYGNPPGGSGGGGAVPEPESTMLVVAAAACWWGTKRSRTGISR